MCTGPADRQAARGPAQEGFVQSPPGQAHGSNPQEVELLRFSCTAPPATCHAAAAHVLAQFSLRTIKSGILRLLPTCPGHQEVRFLESHPGQGHLPFILTLAVHALA